MARLEDLDNWIDTYLQSLKDVYSETDPKRGGDSEIAKHELAQLAIENFWYLHGKLLSWAQAHMTGYAILSNNPQLVSFLEQQLGYQLNEDSHALEQIGLLYNFNPPDDRDPDLYRMKSLLEQFKSSQTGGDEILFTPSAMRRFIYELLMSRCADNSYWRHNLQHSLAALNEGEVDELASPSVGRRQGLPYSLNRWKLEALRQVRFRVGLGYKKYRALEDVGNAIGQSSETLRSWEKDLEKSIDRSVDLYCSELAGIHDRYFKGDEALPAPPEDDFEFHRGLSHLEHARYLHRSITERDFNDIKENIRRYRGSKSGS